MRGLTKFYLRPLGVKTGSVYGVCAVMGISICVKYVRSSKTNLDIVFNLNVSNKTQIWRHFEGNELIQIMLRLELVM